MFHLELHHSAIDIHQSSIVNPSTPNPKRRPARKPQLPSTAHA
jgi:hypothetical protein